jgi:hypothetical protein
MQRLIRSQDRMAKSLSQVSAIELTEGKLSCSSSDLI